MGGPVKPGHDGRELFLAVLLVRRLQSRLRQLAGGVEDSRRYIGWGYNFVAAGVDTVMLAKSGDPLLSASAVDTLRKKLQWNTGGS